MALTATSVAGGVPCAKEIPKSLSNSGRRRIWDQHAIPTLPKYRSCIGRFSAVEANGRGGYVDKNESSLYCLVCEGRRAEGKT